MVGIIIASVAGVIAGMVLIALFNANGDDSMRYKLSRLVDGKWYMWGIYASPEALAKASCELGKMDADVVIKVEVIHVD